MTVQAKEINPVIRAAANRLNLQLDNNDLANMSKDLSGYLNTPSAKDLNVHDLANVALLGVLNVHQTGGYQPTIFQARGNRLGVVDYNPLNGNGGSILAEENNVTTPQGDPLGLKSGQAVDLIGQAPLAPGVQQQLNAYLGNNQSPTPSPVSTIPKPGGTPRPSPYK